MKTCDKCKKEKPYSEFYKSQRIPGSTLRKGDGYRSRCKKCMWQDDKRRMSKWTDKKLKAYSKQQQKYARKWDAAHPHAKKASTANLHAQRVNAPGVLTENDVRECWESWHGKCWICGFPATEIDHYRPINPKGGGTNTPENIRPICRECNHKRDHEWHGDQIAEQEAALLKQIKELIHEAE